MKRLLPVVFALLFLKLAFANTISGWFYYQNCDSFGCLNYGWNPVVIVERNGQVVKAWGIKPAEKPIENIADYNMYLRYWGHAFDAAGNVYLVATHSDCLGEGSYQECLIVAKFSPDGILQTLKTFYSSYRQTDPMYALVETSMFPVKQVSIYNSYLEILLDYPKTPMILLLDSQLNIAAQIKIPWIDDSPPELNALGGRWLAVNGRTLIDLSTGTYYTTPPYYSHYITQVFEIPEGVVVFYSSPTGFAGSSSARIVKYKLTSSGLSLDKLVNLNFSGYGFPGFLKVSRTSSGWLAYLALWRNFGGDISYGVLRSDSALETFQFYTIKGSRRRGWPFLDNETSMFSLEDCPLSDEHGDLYLSLSIDRAASIVSLEALPLEESPIEVASFSHYNDTYSGTPVQLSSVNYITECSDCISLEVADIMGLGPFAVVKNPGMFYAVGTARSGVYRADFFCYAPAGYKAYCGFILGGSIYIYDAASGIVEFRPENIDSYNPLSNIDVPTKLFSVDLCTGYYNTPTIPGVKAVLINVWIPEGLTLSEALSSGRYYLTTIPWEAPDCR